MCASSDAKAIASLCLDLKRSSAATNCRLIGFISAAGAFLLADAYGAQRLVYVKDRDLGTTTLGAAEVRDRGDSPVDALVLDLMANAKHVREIHVVNGQDRGALSDAVNGKPAGTVIAA